ncbi:WD40 repeat-like protein [Trichoderma citrinoviride]|uniref:WD40 repeat-like protein n=1 Tax=Trichoderma citrinoviride TaxID=58853 RepID=A0A2T4AZP5_9HYPO|nr:WD40 repeat-like protein [Trichoderma citrinoviride]PTB62545.1 WD40 repeat-like protein [Trichoderma citrinoviride]
MAKRKRQNAAVSESAAELVPTKKSKFTKAKTTATSDNKLVEETIQIVAGSYDRVLHGLTASIGTKGDVEFADTFLFNAHASAIRCVAVSPPSPPIPGQTQKVLLASGSTDERIQVYNLSAHPPSKKNKEAMLSVAPRPILENPKNRELGTLLHHDSTITALRFPTRSKLLSGSDDSTIAITRTRDWSMLSNIKTPKPKAHGRPTGDTAPFGGTPSGVNDFAIHPSMKLMISVGKGERCMRLWNLVTGKKAGVLSFSKEMLREVGESKHASGEARRVTWGTADGADEFAVGFDRNVVVFGMDSVPKCRVMPTTRVKIHQFSYVTVDEEAGDALLAVATEDGRVMFFSTKAEDLTKPEPSKETAQDDKKAAEPTLPVAKFVGYVGGEGVQGRIKDFAIIPSTANRGTLYVVGASSDGKIRLWTVQAEELLEAARSKEAKVEKPVGVLRGTYETHNRVTCLAAFLMLERPEGVEDSEDEVEEEEEEDSSSEDEE